MKSSIDSKRIGFVDPIWVSLGGWVVVLLGAMLVELNRLEPLFLLFVIGGIAAHVGGMFACRICLPYATDPLPSTGGLQDSRVVLASRLRRGNQLTALYAAILAIALIYFLFAYSEIITSLDASGLNAAREAYLAEARGLSGKRLLYTTHFTLLGIAMMFFIGRLVSGLRRSGMSASRLGFLSISALTLALSLLTTGRTAPLLVLLSFSYYALRFGLATQRAVTFGFVLAFALIFLGVAFALGKEGLGDSYETDAVEAIGNLARVYFFSGPAALQQVVVDAEVVSNACSNILSYPIDLLKRIGFFTSCDQREIEFVFVPVATNVFTFIRAYWEDFGHAYWAGLFVSGMLIEAIHRLASRGASYAVFIFPFFLNSVVLQVFEEQLFSNGSVFAYLTASYIALAILDSMRPRTSSRAERPG